MYQREALGLVEAKQAVEAIVLEALKEPQRPVAIAVVDDQGQMICCVRMDGTTAFNQSMAVKKASTAAQIGTDTSALREALKAIGMAFGDFGSTDMTLVQGGVNITRPGCRSLGAIGVSGRMAHEDEDLAHIGANALKL